MLRGRGLILAVVVATTIASVAAAEPVCDNDARCVDHEAPKIAARKKTLKKIFADVVRSGKTGAIARVAAAHRAAFQAYVDALEATGSRVLFMGGIRRGRCRLPRHKHPCGLALDVCQLGRDVVDPRCHLPSRATMISLARAHGLMEGGAWCHGDRGHAEWITKRQAGACSRSLVAKRRARRARRTLRAIKGALHPVPLVVHTGQRR